jgi:type I restriction enzyme, S subunit
MLARPGYKQTEVGVIPEDWDVAQIGDLRPFVTSGSRGWATYYSDQGSLFVRITNLSRESIYLHLSDSKFVNLPPEAREGTRTRLQQGDVLISITADIGIIGYVDSNVPTPAYINQHIALVRFDSSKTNGKFVSYFLASEKPQKLFRASTDVGAKAGMSLLTVQKLQSALPPIPEQHAIAEALSDVDALLGGMDRLIAKKRDLKQAAMQQLLTGQTRLPGFHGEWEVKRLGELFEITSSKRVFQREWRTEGIPFYRARELAVLGETGRVDNELFITKSLYDMFKNAHGVPEVGDMLVTGVGTLGKVYVVADKKEFYFKDGNIIWFKINGKVSAEFLRQLYLTKVVMKQITEGSAGTTVGTYTMSGAKKTERPFPPFAEQTAIAAVLSDMDAELAALEQRREKTRDLKQAMMQELLTGKTRVVSQGDSDARTTTL